MIPSFSRAAAAALLLSSVGLCAPALAADREFRSVDEVLGTFKNEPAVGDVQGMVLEYSKTDTHYVEAWLAATKNAALLPKLQVSYEHDLSQDDDYDWISPDAESDPISQLSGSGVGTDDKVKASATWELNKLVMSSERIRMISETQDIVKLRDKVLEEVTRVYFERRRLQVDMLMAGPGDLKTQIKNQMRLDELTAQLDAYTGGRFSASLARGAAK
jgi:hypothetical protein